MVLGKKYNMIVIIKVRQGMLFSNNCVYRNFQDRSDKGEA